MLMTWMLVVAALGQATRPAEGLIDANTLQVAAANTSGAAEAVVFGKEPTLPSQPKIRVATPAMPTTRPAQAKLTTRPAAMTKPVKPSPLAGELAKLTTQPALIEQLLQAASTTRPAMTARTTSQPSVTDVITKLRQAAGDKPESAVSMGNIGKLTGNPVDVEVTTDGTLVLYGEEKDLAILESFVQMMESQPLYKPTFQIYKLKSGDAGDLASKIEQFWNTAKKPQSGQIRPEDRVAIIPEPRANILMVAATETNMEILAGIINQLDQPSLGETVKFEPVAVKHAKATEIEQKLKDIMKSLQARRNMSKDLFTIQADPRTNMLLISAPEADMDQIKHLISLLDVEPTAESGAVVKVAVYPLQKAVAKDLADALSKMLESDTDAAKAMKETIRRLQVMVKSPDGSQRTLSDLDLDKPIKLYPEPGTNSIIVATVEKNVEPLAEIVRLLDSVPLADQMVVRLFPLEHADSEALLTSLRDMFEQGKRLPEQPGKTVPGRIPTDVVGQALAYNIGLGADKRTNTLIVSGRTEQVLLIQQIIKSVDVPQIAGQSAPRLIVLKHADVKNITDGMQKLVDQQQKVAEKTLSPTAAERERVMLIPDARTNSIIVVAKDDKFKELSKLAADLDGVEDNWLGEINIINLDRLTATDLADKIKELWEKRAELRREGGLKEDKPVIVADTRSNSLVIASRADDFKAIQDVVKKLENQKLAPMAMVRMVALKHNDVTKVAEMMRKLWDERIKMSMTKGQEEQPSDRVAFIDEPLTRTMLVASSAENFELIKQWIAQIDVPNAAEADYAPRMVMLKHADVKTICDGLQKLVEQQQKVAEKKMGATAAELERTVLIPDTRINGIIVMATGDKFQEIATLAGNLDGVEENWLGQINIINLEHLTATDLSGKIKELWDRRAELRRAGGLKEDKPVIVADARSNSLVVASSADDFQAIQQVVKKLEDQRLAPMAAIRLVSLKNNDVTKIAEIIRKLWDERLKMSLAKGQEEQPSDRIAIVEEPLTRTMLVASSSQNYEEITQLVTKLDVPPSVDGVFKTFIVRYADIGKASTLLKDLFDKGLYVGSGDKKNLPESATKVTIVSDLRSSSLIVSASPQNLAIIEALLKEVDREDVPALPTDARFFPLKYADVVNLADMLDQMFKGMQASMSSDQKDQLEVKIIPDVRTRSLIVTGTRYAIKRAEELVPKLDIDSKDAAYSFKVYVLKEGSAANLEPVITKLFEKRGSSDQGGKRIPIHIEADAGSNSLVVTASQDDHRMIEYLLTLLDKKSTIAEQMEVFPLAEAKAKQLADMLTKLIEQQQGADRKGGFAVTPEERTNSLLVWAAPSLMDNVRTIIAKLDNSRSKAEMALRVFRLKNAKAENLAKQLDDFFEKAGSGKANDARQMIIKFAALDPLTGEEKIRSLVHQDVTISPDKITNSLLVLAPEEHIDMMAMMIQMLDSVEPQTADLMVFPLRNADAKEMQKLLEELFNPKTSGQGEEKRQLVFANGAAGSVEGGGGTSIEVAFSVDERTNSLIAAGAPSYLKIVEKLVYELDYREIEERIQRVIQVRNRPANEVAKTMKAYFEEESKALEQAQKGEAAVKQLMRQVTIEDGGEGSNALVLSYSPRMESQVIAMVNELDRAPPQVMIQVLMAEVSLDDRFEMGMEFSLQDLVFSENSYKNANGVVKGEGYDKIFGTDLGATGTGGGGISFTVTGEDFNFLIRALQTEGNVEILSRPSILVQDNQEANITVGTRVPTVQDVVISTGGVVTPSVTYEKVGVIMTVTPIVNSDGYVSMEIKPEISSLGTSNVTVASGVTLPTFNERSAETTVTVKDGETIIIGGLIETSDSRSGSKVPLAGDVPILGNLFRSTIKTASKKELLIMLTPHVVRTPEEAKALSVQIRDQTGLNDNLRKNPMLQGLQVNPDEEQFGPVDILRPTGEQKKRSEEGPDQLGPEVEEMGPPVSSMKVGIGTGAVAAGARK